MNAVARPASNGAVTCPTCGSRVAVCGPVTFDPFDLSVTIKGKNIPLTHMEYRVMATLVDVMPNTITATGLLDAVWAGRGVDRSGNVQAATISRLRGKIAPVAAIIGGQGGTFRLKVHG